MEILFCSDTEEDLDVIVKSLKTSITKRLIKLIRINKNNKIVEQFSFLAKHASLIMIRLKQINKQSLNLLKLASILAPIYKFILIPVIGNTHFQCESYDYANVSDIIIDGLWQCYILSRTNLLIKHLCYILDTRNNIEIMDEYESLKVKMFKSKEVPLRVQDNNVLIYCYGILENNALLKQMTQKIILARQKPIIIYNKGQVQSKWLINCNLIRTKYKPKIEMNIIYFCTMSSMKFNKVVSVQVIRSENLLKQMLKDLSGIKPSEIIRKIWFPETEGKIFIKSLGTSRSNLCLSQSIYNKNEIIISNRVNYITFSLLNRINLKSSRRKIAYVLANYPPDDGRIGNGVGLDTLESITNINNMINGNELNYRPLIDTLLMGVTNRTILNRTIRATISLSLAFCQQLNWISDVEKIWGSLLLDAFVISNFCLVPVIQFGKNIVMVQPTRGYGLTCPNIYHSSFIVPCAFYCLSYLFLERVLMNTLIFNVGKHGNLEWMPGKSIALSRWCYPERILRSTTNAYLYIVNDPGEGTQAKRRINSTIIDHDIPLITEYPVISDWHGIGFDCYSKLEDEYICSLLDLQFKCKMHCWCEFSLHEIVYSTLVLNKWQIITKSVNLSLNVKQWWRAKHRWMVCSGLTNRIMFKEYSTIQIKDINVVMRLVSLRLASCYAELNSIIKVKNNSFIHPGLGSSFSRADDNILPTGRNFYTKNVDKMPTPLAYNISKVVVSKLIRRYYYRSCQWLKSVAINVWATSNMRTGGDDIAIIMNLIGVKPIWHKDSLKVIGFEVLPLNQLKHPRIKVLVRASGLFRDTCSLVLSRLYKMFSIIENLQESIDCSLQWSGILFCSRPGSYGVGIQELLDGHNPLSLECLAKKYILYGGYYFNGKLWTLYPEKLNKILSKIQVVLQTQDNYEHDLLDSDDYYQFEGGLNAAVRYCRGGVCAYHIDTSRAIQRIIKIRRLKHELARMVSCKLLNINWIYKILENGYKGGTEILANINYFCNFAITTGQIANSQFNDIYCLYFQNKELASLIIKYNTDAYLSIKQKLFEVTCNGTWQVPSNSLRLFLGKK
ncbi:Aerobic cobaltochelatase subunit CobN [Candidatus Hodgkinia cicadicola]|uniref:Aerobic cobaltochelatase subunit CobN n=1 Tax=Candidatus Hodgkinia cicadicola TaxID=573658 RepID=A0ABX4MIZ7_9HYPH|nr:Aerobic cobaltochelatase subunit CobN [Candidatus Hodgkinia cicadicola]